MKAGYSIKKIGGKSMPFKRIIIFDGECGFCSRWVIFVLKKDLKKQFKYTSLQGQFIKSLLLDIDLTCFDTLIYLREDMIWIKSTAVLNILKDLGGGWLWLYFFFKWLPRSVRDFVYDTVAKYRYGLFGKQTCPVHEVSDDHRFID